jgi:hypothetical protein
MARMEERRDDPVSVQQTIILVTLLGSDQHSESASRSVLVATSQFLSLKLARNSYRATTAADTPTPEN